MAALLNQSSLENFYNIETPKASDDHETLQFDTAAFNQIMLQFSDCLSKKQIITNQSHNNDTLSPSMESANAATPDHIQYNKITSINLNWSSQLKAMHKANNN